MNEEKPLRKHFMQRVKQAANNLAKVASIERLRNRIIAPSNSTSSDEEYMDVINEDINIPETVVLENSENGREQGVHNEEQGVHEQGVHNEDVIEALDLSDDEDDEIVLQDEVDHEDNASEDSDDYDEDINENLFETEEQKANYVAENLREWAIYEGSISKKKLDNLLHRLNPVFPTLPKSYKTLLRTPKHLDVYELPDGSKLWYKGIFIVVKFLSTGQDDDVYYEVALAKWIVQIDENMIGQILWPQNDAIAGKLVRSEAKADETWQQLEVEVKRYYETYIDARNAARGFEKFASAYESDSGCQLGRGMRRKRIMNPFSSEDDSSGSDNKKCKQDKSKSKIKIAPLPPPLPASLSSLEKSLNISKENVTPLTVVCNKKQGKTTASPASTVAGIKRHKFLDKIINLRQQAADKAQQRKKAMSLRNISVRKKTVNSTLCSEPSVKAFEASESCGSESQRSIVSSLNSQSIEESSPTSSEMSKNIQSPLPQSLSNKTKISVTQIQPCHYRSSSSHDSIRQTPPRDFDEFVTTKDKSKIDIEPDEVSLDSSRTILTSKLTTNTTTFNNLDESLVKLNQKVDNMRAKLDLILINQCKMNRFLMPEEKIFSQPPNMPALPLDTIEQVKIFEKFLSNDVQLADTCYYLKSLSLGNDEARAVSKLMSNLMSNSLAQEFNFDGHGNKLAFKSTKLWELVQGTLLLKFEQSDLNEALKSLRSWLRNAKGRKPNN